MATSTITKKKFKLKYMDNNGTYTYSNLKKNAGDYAVYNTAYAFAMLQKYSVENIFKIEESEITN